MEVADWVFGLLLAGARVLGFVLTVGLLGLGFRFLGIRT